MESIYSQETGGSTDFQGRNVELMHSMLGKIFADNNITFFFSYFSQKIGFDSSCKIPPVS